MFDPMSNQPVVTEACTNRYHAFMVSIAKTQAARPSVPSVILSTKKSADDADERRRRQEREMEDPERWDGLS